MTKSKHAVGGREDGFETVRILPNRRFSNPGFGYIYIYGATVNTRDKKLVSDTIPINKKIIVIDTTSIFDTRIYIEACARCQHDGEQNTFDTASTKSSTSDIYIYIYIYHTVCMSKHSARYPTLTKGGMLTKGGERGRNRQSLNDT